MNNHVFQEISRFQLLSEDLQSRVSHQEDEIQRLGEDKARLVREITQIKANFANSSKATGAMHKAQPPSELAMKDVGPLKVYEIVLGLMFLCVIWNFLFS